MYRWASFVVLVLTIVVIGVLFFRILSGFFVPLFLAAILAVVFHPLHGRLVDRMKGRRALGALLTTAIVAMVIVIPSVLIVTLAILEGVALIAHGDMDRVPNRLRELRAEFGFALPFEEEVRAADAALQGIMRSIREREVVSRRAIETASNSLRDLAHELQGTDYDALIPLLVEARSELRKAERVDAREDAEVFLIDANREYQNFRNELSGGPIWRAAVDLLNPTEEVRREWISRLLSAAQTYLVPVGGAAAMFTLQSLFGLVIMLLSVYFFFYDGPSMIETVMKLSPLDDRYEQELIRDFANISRAVVIATLLSAAVQGALAGLGFQLAGVGSVFLLSLLTFLFAMVPFFGAATVWVPVAIWLYFVNERPWAALSIAIYGGLIVSNADNVVKLLVLHGQSRLHPLLALISVLGGVRALGPIGILVGPMIVVCLQSLLNILHRELTSLDYKRT